MIFLLIFLFLAAPALAVVNPQSGSAAVSATVPADPDTPVLIAPANNSTVSTVAPSFIFNPAFGTVIINHYELWLDGKKNTSPIGQSLQTVITQAQTGLAEGAHTWSIMAVANNGRTRNSTTWTFTIDITAPLILVDRVAGQETSLSSLDLTPWQKTVSFSTSGRYPKIEGQSEAGATLTVNFNDQTVSAAIGTDRRFSIQPKTALLPGRYQVSVSSSDPAGNNTALPPFYLDITAPPAALTINLPSPLPDLSFTAPVRIPQSLFPVSAFPLVPAETGCTCSWLPWLIALLLLIYLVYVKYKLKHQKISKTNT